MDITVGLCSRNRKDVLEKVLLSLTDQSIEPDSYEVVLVDDGSTDGTGEMAKSLELPYRLVYVRQDHSGLATARNTGLANSVGEVILYIDDDVLADPKLLEEHLKIHRRYDKCVVNGWVNHVEEPVRPPKPKFTMADISTSFFWTSNVSVKKKYLDQAGRFDQDFKEYGWEDQEVGLRLMALGLRNRNNYKAIGYHVKRPPKYSDVPRALAQAEAKARTALIYINKHPRMRTRMSTGTHPPRVAWANFCDLGGLLEKYCRRVLRLDSDGPQCDDTLDSRGAWCLKQLSTIHYFRALQGKFSVDPGR